MAATALAAASVGMGAFGMHQGSKATSAANAANRAQQAAALKFQRQMQKKQLAEIADMQKGATAKILASSKRTRGNVLEKLAGRGWDPGGGVGLSAMRSGARDETNALSQLASQMAAQRQAVYTGQEFPMIQHTGGQAMSAAGMGLIGAGLGMGFELLTGDDDDPGIPPPEKLAAASGSNPNPYNLYGGGQLDVYGNIG